MVAEWLVPAEEQGGEDLGGDGVEDGEGGAWRIRRQCQEGGEGEEGEEGRGEGTGVNKRQGSGGERQGGAATLHGGGSHMCGAMGRYVHTPWQAVLQVVGELAGTEQRRTAAMDGIRMLQPQVSRLLGGWLLGC